MSPKKVYPIATKEEREDLRRLDGLSKDSIRIGIFYSKLTQHQKSRFQRIVKSLARKLALELNRNPLEMILVRQIALNSIRIEDAELSIIEGENPKYMSNVEKWLFLAQKERRDAISLLATVARVTEKSDRVSSFKVLRDVLREEEGLPPTEEGDFSTGGYKRRFGSKTKDGVERTSK